MAKKRKTNGNGRHSAPLQAHVRRVIASGLKKGKFENAQFATHMQMAPARVIEILKGDRNIQLDELPKIAEFFGKQLYELVTVKGKHDECPLCNSKGRKSVAAHRNGATAP